MEEYFESASVEEQWSPRLDLITFRLKSNGDSLWSDTVENLILDLLEWVGCKERTYQETMDAWRTSCPRLPVWEDANDRGLVETAPANSHLLVRLTPAGLAFLKEQRPHSYRGAAGGSSA